MRPPAPSRPWLIAGACLVAATTGTGRVRANDTAEDAEATAATDAPAAGRSGVPPVPEGGVDDLLAYIESLDDPAKLPESRGRRRYYRRKALANKAEAVDRILAQLPPDDARRADAVRLKFAALEELDSLGDRSAAEALAAFATTLADGPDAALAAKARAIAVRAEADALVAAGRLDDAPAAIRRMAALLEADPDDTALAEAAAGFATKLDRMPGGETAARLAHETFVPLLARSGNERIATLAARLAGAMRLLSLPGNPMPISGRLLDGSAFDQQSLAGKVVLVDFWATWCGPCVAEIENIRKQYDRHHDRGFEVLGISLDDDRAALERFVADREIPWPILVDAAAADAGGEAMATRYGISGIPQCVLIGRDGTVISTTARGGALAALLAEQFDGDGPAAD